MHRRRAWKAYFAFVLAANLALAAFLIVAPEIYGATGNSYVDFLVSAVAVTGLYGFCFRKRIARRSFWKVIFPTIVIWDIYISGVADWTDWEGFREFIPGIAISLALGFPLYLAVYRYAFREDETWNPTGAGNAHGAT